MLSAMGNVDTSRLLDPRFLHLDGARRRAGNTIPEELFPDCHGIVIARLD